MRSFSALLRRDAVDLVCSPALLASLLVVPALMLVWGFLFERDANRVAYVLSLASCFSCGMAGATAMLLIMHEEWESNAYLMLRRSGVTGEAIAASKLAAGIIMALAMFVATYVLSVFDLSVLPAVVGTFLVGSLPIMLISLGFGLMATTQDRMNAFTAPILVLGVVPQFTYDPGGSTFIWLSPTGPLADALAFVATGLVPATPWPMLLASYAAWLVASVVFVAFALRFFKRTTDKRLWTRE